MNMNDIEYIKKRLEDTFNPETHYDSKEPCKKCSSTIRYVKTPKSCVVCLRLYDLNRRAKKGQSRYSYMNNKYCKVFVNDKPCKKCGSTVRYRNGTKSCVACTKTINRNKILKKEGYASIDDIRSTESRRLMIEAHQERMLAKEDVYY